MRTESKAKIYLSQIQEYRRRFEEARNHYYEVRARAESPRTSSLGSDRISNSSDPDRMSEQMSRLERAQVAALEALATYHKFFRTALQQLDQVDSGLYWDVLFLRYFQGLNFTQMGKELEKDESYLRHAHGRALQAFEEAFEISEGCKEAWPQCELTETSD